MVERRTLAEVIAADGPLPPRQAARVGAQIPAPLVRGHRSGLVHGAVEPGRVVLGRGRAVLSAFAAGPLDASPEYRAPKRLAGRPPGPEADLWSLGATLYTAVEADRRRSSHPRRVGPGRSHRSSSRCCGRTRRSGRAPSEAIGGVPKADRSGSVRCAPQGPRAIGLVPTLSRGPRSASRSTRPPVTSR